MSYVAVDRQVVSRERFDRVEAYTGYEVCDREGREIGRVHQLLVDANGASKQQRVADDR